jgi:hypothetical protein
MLNKDADLKIQRGYKHPKSFVRNDGSEVLKGGDWIKRKWELQKRSAGMCERSTVLGRPHNVLCYGRGGEPHHIKRRSAGRDDRLANLANLSHACHKAEDPRKTRFGEGKK